MSGMICDKNKKKRVDKKVVGKVRAEMLSGFETVALKC